MPKQEHRSSNQKEDIIFYSGYITYASLSFICVWIQKIYAQNPHHQFKTIIGTENASSASASASASFAIKFTFYYC
jgi:beta-glucanase (GH16 family)